MSPETAAGIILSMKSNKAIEIMEALPDAKAGKVLAAMKPATEQLKILRAMKPETAAGTITAIEAKAASAIVQELQTYEAAEILNHAEDEKVAAIMEELREWKAAEVLADMKAQAAAGDLAAMEDVEAAGIEDEMPANSAGSILSAMDSKKASAILLSLSAKPMAILNAMDEDKAAAAVKHMSDDEAKLFLADADGPKVAAIVKGEPNDRVCAILKNMKEGPAANALKHLDNSDTLLKEIGDPKAERLEALMGTTAAISKATAKKRMLLFASVAAFWVGGLVLGGFCAVWKKSKKLSLGPCVISSRGCFFNGKRLCGQTAAAPRSAAQPLVGDDEEQPRIEAQGNEAQGNEAEPPQEEEGAPQEAAVVVPNDEQALEAQRLLLEQNARLLMFRKIVLSMLFAGYVGVSLGIPYLKRKDVSCANGFFWEDHLPFLGIFGLTKTAELLVYVLDPTVQGELSLTAFMLKFLPSFLGYADGYTDATAITIACSCDNPMSQALGKWMFLAYAVGVVLAQWLVIACLAHRDSSHACLMKVIHMDALAACVTLPPDAKPIWVAVNLARTIAEDIPQSILQVLFILNVNRNYFMMVSVAVSLGSSLKAIWDAMHRTLAAIGAKYGDLAREEGGPVLEEWGSTADRFDMIFRHPRTDFCVHLRDGSNGWIYIMKGNLTRKVEGSGALRRDTLSGGQEGKQKLTEEPTHSVLVAGDDYVHGQWTVKPLSEGIEIHHRDKGHMYTLKSNSIEPAGTQYATACTNMMSIMSPSASGSILRAWGSKATTSDLTLMHKATKFHVHLRNGSNGWLYVMKGNRCAKVEPKSRSGEPSATSPFGGGQDQKDSLEENPDQNMLPEDGSEYKHGTWTLQVVDNTITLTHERESKMYILTESTVEPAADHSRLSVQGMITFMNS